MSGATAESKENVLIVDDVAANLMILVELIRQAGYTPRPVTSVEQAQRAIRAYLPQLILLDVTMPGVDGFEYCEMLKQDVRTRDVPVIFISAMNGAEIKSRGFQLGAVDFITKPFDQEEVTLRVNTHMKLYRMQKELENYNRRLHKLINEQVLRIANEQRKVIYSFAKMTEARDDLSGRHLENVGKNARLLAISLQLFPKYENDVTGEFIDAIEQAAPLHDVGKILIPDSILLKPGRLTEEEMEIMKTHSEIGAKIMQDIYTDNEHNLMLWMAIDIAHYHHEKWDGSGYPKGLKGEEIPLAAQIMAVVDVYDTLIGARCYKKAYSHEYAMRVMNAEAGKSFSPDIIEIFNKVQKRLSR